MTAKSIITPILLLLLLAACAPATTPAPTPDLNAVYTAAAETVIVGFSQTAEALPSPTEEPLPTATISVTEAPSPTPTFGAIIAGPGTALLCDDAKYVIDITIPDGSPMTAGQEFLKTWKIRNTGACTWGAGYTIVFGYGEKMGGVPAALNTTVIPGQEVEVSVQFKAPTKVGEYKGWWRMANAQNSAFGEFFSVWIIVR